MNRIVCTLIALLAFVIVTESQAQVSFGMRAGLNLAGWKGDASQTVQGLLDNTNGVVTGKMREGFHAGVYARVPIGRRFSVEPGLQYSQKGVRMLGTYSAKNLEFINAKAEITNQAHYLDLPVLAKVYLTEGFHIYLGPQVSYLLANNLNAQASVLGFSVLNRDLDVTNEFQKLDVALTGGLGYRFANGFNMQAGYDYGLRRVDERANFDTYNHVIKVSLGYEF